MYIGVETNFERKNNANHTCLDWIYDIVPISIRVFARYLQGWIEKFFKVEKRLFRYLFGPDMVLRDGGLLIRLDLI